MFGQIVAYKGAMGKINNVDDAKREIRAAVRGRGPFWNNLVSCILRIVADDFGKAEANKLIEECDLKRLGWREESE